MIPLNNAPRDVNIDKDSKEKYESLARKFNITVKSVFVLSMKAGFFYNTPKKIKNISNLVQFSTLKDDDIMSMLIIAYSTLKDIDKIFDGKEIVGICQEFSNGGVEYLYDLFVLSEKDDLRVIEDIVEEINEIIF